MAIRHSNTDRKGVNFVESIVINDFDWIFREQPIQDYGIDAHIEIVENGNPTGVICGVQIKSGKSHFHPAKENLTYYPDELHFKYWTNSSIPILLVGYFPEKNKGYWQLLSDPGIYSKTRKGYKLDVPYNNLFDKNSLEEIDELISSFGEKIDIRKPDYSKDDRITAFELGELIRESLDEIKESTNRMTTSVDNYTNNIWGHTDKVNQFVNQGLDLNDRRVQDLLRRVSADLNILARRISPEIEIFEDRFNSALTSLRDSIERYLILYPKRKFVVIIQLGNPSQNLLESLEYAHFGISSMRNSIITLPSLSPSLKKGKRNAGNKLNELLNTLLDTQEKVKNLQKLMK